MGEHESHTGEPAAESPVMDELDLRGRTEKLVSQLAELYNENTLLRERVRRLEKEMRRASNRADVDVLGEPIHHG